MIQQTTLATMVADFMEKKKEKKLTKTAENEWFLRNIREYLLQRTGDNPGQLLFFFSFAIAVYDCFPLQFSTVRFKKMNYRIQDLPVTSEEPTEYTVYTHVKDWIFLLTALEYDLLKNPIHVSFVDGLKQSVSYWLEFIEMLLYNICQKFIITTTKYQYLNVTKKNNGSSVEYDDFSRWDEFTSTKNVFMCKFCTKIALSEKEDTNILNQIQNFKTKLDTIDLEDVSIHKMTVLNLQVNPYNFDAKPLTSIVNGYKVNIDSFLYILNYYNYYLNAQKENLPELPYKTYMLFFAFKNYEDPFKKSIRIKKCQKFAKTFFSSCKKSVIDNSYQTGWMSKSLKNSYLNLFNTDINNVIQVETVQLLNH